MTNELKFLELVTACVDAGVFKKLVFSRLPDKNIIKIYAELRAFSGTTIFVVFTQKADGKLLQTNIPLGSTNLVEVLAPFAGECRQANLLAGGAECEYKRGKSGNSTIVNAKAIERVLGRPKGNSSEIKPLNKEKNYILRGDEPFLKELGISDAGGRIHDKKQAKFRQINRFLEYVSDIVQYLPKDETVIIYDLCCGKSYLSFAVYHYFTYILGRDADMTGVDLKADVMELCNDIARTLGFDGLRFICGDINIVTPSRKPHLVLSLHACDTATDAVLARAAELSADVILATPCCHRELSRNFDCPPFAFAARHSILKSKLCDALTDSLRLLFLEKEGYDTLAAELIDPNDTPKNVLLRAVRLKNFDKNSEVGKKLASDYENTYLFLTGGNK